MIIIAIAIDYLFHRLEFVSAGIYFGYAGTALIIVSFIYSLRKRKLIKSGSPKKLLVAHEYMAWAGSVMIIVHGGIHFNALLPWLALIMMIIAVASGLTGKFLLKKASETYKEKLQELMKSGITKQAAEEKIFMDSIMIDWMKKWRDVHLPITLLLCILTLLHILTIIMFTK